MSSAILLKAACILFLIALAEILFTFYYFHHANSNGTIGTTFYKKTNKPFISTIIGVFGAVLMASSVVCLVFGLLLRA